MSNYDGNDLNRRYSSSVNNSPDTAGVFIGTVTKVVSASEVYVKVPRLTGVFENLVRLGVDGVSVGDQVYVSLVEGRRDEFVILGKQQPNVDTPLYPTNEPTGFTQRTDSAITFDSLNKRFTIQPVGASFEVWCKGISYTKTAAESVVITDTSDVHYVVYLDGVLTTKTTYFDLENEAPVAYIYWNYTDQAAYFLADERHGIVMDWATHEYLHRTRGAALATGLTLTNYTTTGTGSLAADAQVGLADGTFYDEDLQIDVTHSASPAAYTWQQKIQTTAYMPIFYKVGSAGLWKKDTATAYPVKFGTRAQYNLNTSGTWSAVDATSNKFIIYWVVATNNLSDTTGDSGPVLSIMGQSEYDTIGQAEAVLWSDMVLTGLPIFEFRILYKLIFQTNTGYTNAVKSKLVSAVDLRVSTTLASGIPASPVVDHGFLTGLADDDHPQYALVSGSRAFTGAVTVSSTTASTNTTTGALIVSGGAGIAGTVNATTVAATSVTATTLSGSLAASSLTGTSLPSSIVGSSLTSLGTLGSLSVTGTATAGTFSGSGASLTAIPVSQLTGTTIPASVVSSSLTSVGTLTSLNVGSYANLTSTLPAQGTVVSPFGTQMVAAAPFSRQWADWLRWRPTSLTETSADGITFSTYTGADWTHRPFIGDTAGTWNTVPVLDGTTITSVRWTWSSGVQFSENKWLALAVRYAASAPVATITWETSPDGTTWTTQATASSVALTNKWTFIRFDESYASVARHRITIKRESGNIYLTSIQWLTNRPGDQGSGSSREQPFASISSGRGIVVQPTLTTETPLSVRPVSGGTAALQTWTNDTGGTIYLQVLSDGRLQSTIATGTAPLVIASTTAVANLNADLLDGQHGTYYNAASNLTGTSLPAAIVSSSLTSVGTLGSLNVTGDTTTGGLLFGSRRGRVVTGVGMVSATADITPTTISAIDVTGATTTLTGLVTSDIILVTAFFDITLANDNLDTVVIGLLSVGGTQQQGAATYRNYSTSVAAPDIVPRHTVGQTWTVTGVSGSVVFKLQVSVAPAVLGGVTVLSPSTRFTYVVMSSA